MPIFVPGPGGTPTPPAETSGFTATALVGETLGNLGGHTLDNGQWTYLTAPMTDSGLTMQVKDPAKVGRGVAEVDEELVMIEQTSDAGVTIAPFGRGFQGTPRTIHQPNAPVFRSPRFPRYRVRQKINQIIESIYPALFAVGTVEIEPDGTRVAYDLPNDVEMVLTVEQDTFGPAGNWRTLTRWHLDTDADTDDFAGGNSLTIYEAIDVGRTIQVTYAKHPAPLQADGSWADTGLNESAWPAVMYGVMHQLIASQSAGMSGLDTVRTQESSGRRVSPIELSERYFALHQQLLQAERARLLEDHPITNPTEW